MFVKLSKRFFLIPSPQFGDRFRNGLNHNLFDWECDSALFYSGRCALLAGVKLLASVSPEKNEILVPAYICEGALFALRDAGFSFKYYSADDQFNFDRTEMESKINKNTVAILIVHYFGIPQRLETIRTLCNDRNIFLIEDCAHAFGSREVDIPLGSVGDISIFSFKKFLPIGDGGALVVNNKKVRKEFKKIHTVTTSTTKGCPNITVKSLLNTLEYKYGVSIRKNRLRHDMSIEELCPRTDLTRERECFTESEPISDYSKKILFSSDIVEIARRRSENYNLLGNALKGIKGLDLPAVSAKESWSLFAFPVLVKEACQLKIIRALVKSDIFATDWPTLPLDLEGQEKDNACSLLKRIILLPVHQDISAEESCKIGEAARQAMRICYD